MSDDLVECHCKWSEALAEELDDRTDELLKLEAHAGRLALKLDKARETISRIGKILDDYGCGCDCGSDLDDHNDNCGLCIGCTISLAIESP